MTSTNQTSSGSIANLVSSSPELLTRPASKPDDRPNSSTGELCTSRVRKIHFLASNRTDLHFTTLQTIHRSGCSACSAYPYEKIRYTVAARKEYVSPNVEDLSQHFCNIQAVDFAGFSRCLQITQNFSNADLQPETSSEIVVRFVETLLRFAETSQQTLRQISLVPITYINFAEKKCPENKKAETADTHHNC
jgi:hypothetical protein